MLHCSTCFIAGHRPKNKNVRKIFWLCFHVCFLMRSLTYNCYFYWTRGSAQPFVIVSTESQTFSTLKKSINRPTSKHAASTTFRSSKPRLDFKADASRNLHECYHHRNGKRFFDLPYVVHFKCELTYRNLITLLISKLFNTTPSKRY